MKLNLKITNKEQEIIKEYLETSVSEELAEKINNGVLVEKDGNRLINKKTLGGFMKYACEEVRKQSKKGATSACVEQEIVFGWAIHYFEEDSIIDSLYNLNGTEYKPVQKSVQRSHAPTVEKKTPVIKNKNSQISLFNFADMDKTTSEQPFIVDKETGELLPIPKEEGTMPEVEDEECNKNWKAQSILTKKLFVFYWNFSREKSPFNEVYYENRKN